MREFQLSQTGRGHGVSCDASGAFVDSIPLLKRTDDNKVWEPRDSKDVSAELSTQYGLLIDLSSKVQGIKAAAHALNEGSVARAQLIALNLRFPDRSPLAKAKPSRGEVFAFVRALCESDLIKADWDEDEHPRWPAGTSESQGGRFAPKGSDIAGQSSIGADDSAADAPNSFVQNGSKDGTLDSGVYHPEDDSAQVEQAADRSSHMVLWETNPEAPYYATDKFRAWFDGSVTEFLVADAIAKAYTGDTELYREPLTGEQLQLPGGDVIYRVYNVRGGPGMENAGRFAHNPATNVYYYSPYRYWPRPDVPNAWVEFHYPVFGKPKG